MWSYRWRHLAVHLVRCVLFASVLVVINFQHRKARTFQQEEFAAPTDLARVEEFFPNADTVRQVDRQVGWQEVVDAAGRQIGQVTATSPLADDIVGYCGPTNVLIGLDRGGRIVGIHILASHDTRDHVAEVRSDERFLRSFNGLTGQEVAEITSVDAVSGATLTSLAIHESIVCRLTGTQRSLRFPAKFAIQAVQGVFPQAHTVEPDDVDRSWWRVEDRENRQIGWILRTSPAADNVMGYQGPTDTLLGLNSAGRVIGMAIGSSYDNEPYVSYVRDDPYFNKLFHGLSLEELTRLDLEEAQIEGVSGATMTSMAVAEGITQTADAVHRAREGVGHPPRGLPVIAGRDLATCVVVAVGVVVGLSRLRGKRGVQWSLNGLVIGYFGLLCGDMLSLSLIGGWAQHGVAWRHGLGLVVLALAAFTIPIVSRRNIYCSHLCPHGALQKWTHYISPWHIRIPRQAARMLAWIPLVLLAVGVLITMRPSTIGLVDLEAFDAWHFRIAGPAALTIAIVGLVASLFSPMAYCRYGCPTGALLKAMRRNSRSGEWTRRDWAVAVLLGWALVLYLT